MTAQVDILWIMLMERAIIVRCRSMESVVLTAILVHVLVAALMMVIS